MDAFEVKSIPQTHQDSLKSRPLLSPQVRLTPQRLKNTRTMTQNREPVRLMMAPFSSKSVITFEDIPVTKTARRFLIIENPLEDEPRRVTLSCKNTQKPVRNLQFEWLENTVPPMGEVTVEINWTPAENVACKETFFVTDQRGFKKELHIIFKSIGGKSGKSATTNRLPLRARNGGGGGNGNFLTVAPTKRSSKTPSPPSKKRVTGQRLSPLNDPPYKATAAARRTPTPKRRDYHQQQQPLSTFADDKENSPRAFNASDIFNNIQFTPAADRNRTTSDYMASLPTPTLGEVHNNIQRNINHHQNLVSGKKIVWSPIFENIREEVRVTRTSELVVTPEIIVTQHPEERIQTVSGRRRWKKVPHNDIFCFSLTASLNSQSFSVSLSPPRTRSSRSTSTWNCPRIPETRVAVYSKQKQTHLSGTTPAQRRILKT